MKIIGSDKGIHSPEFHRKKKREQYIRRALSALIVLVVIGVPIYVARMHKLLISSVEVRGNEVTKSEDIQKIVADDLAGDYLLVFPKSNTFLYPKQKIIRDLLAREPRLASVTLTKNSLRDLRIAVTERAPVAEYCKDVSGPSAPADCYFIDTTGYIFAPAPAFSGNVYLTYATTDLYENPIGQTVLPASDFAETLSFAQSLGNIGIYARVFLVKSDEYHILLSNGADIMWERSENLEDVYRNLASFLADKSVESDPSFLARVAYIDMRFGDKIFYKFRGE